MADGAKGGFWLAAAAIVLVMIGAPGRASGLWGARAAAFLTTWGRYQGLFSGSYSIGVLLVSRKKAVLAWSVPAVALGFAAWAAGR